MTGTIFSGSPYLNPNNQNVYTIDFSGTRAIEIVREEYDENFSNLVERRVSNAHADGQPYIGTNFVIRNHNAGYITTIYDANGSQIGRIQVVVTGRTVRVVAMMEVMAIVVVLLTSRLVRSHGQAR